MVSYKITMFCQIIVQKTEIQEKQGRNKTKWRKAKQKSKNLNDKTDSSKKYVMGQFYEGSGLGWGEAKGCRMCQYTISPHVLIFNNKESLTIMRLTNHKDISFWWKSMFCGIGIKPIYKKADDVRAWIYIYDYEMVCVQ